MVAVAGIRMAASPLTVRAHTEAKAKAKRASAILDKGLTVTGACLPRVVKCSGL